MQTEISVSGIGQCDVLGPAMETLCEPFRLFALEGEHHLARPFGLLASHVLQVHLGTFVGQFDFYVATFCPDPDENLISIVQYHDVLIH